MSLSNVIAIRMDKLDKKIAEQIQLCKISPKQALEENGKFLMRDFMSITPPTRDKNLKSQDRDDGISQSEGRKRQGEAAIRRDIGKLFSAVEDEHLYEIGSKYGLSNIDTWETKSDGSKLHIVWDRIDPSGSGIGSRHAKARDGRGRVRGSRRYARSKSGEWYAEYAVTKTDYQSYLRMILSRVGRQLAGWAIGYLAMGGKGVPAWVKRHFSGVRGSVHPTNTNQLYEHPEVIFRNWAAGAGDPENTRRFSEALRIRCEKLTKRLAYLMRPKKK